MTSRLISMVVVAFVATTIFLPATSSPRRELKKFEKFIKVMDRNYIDSLDYHYLIEVAINAILDQTDPYSTYMGSKQVDELSSLIESPSIDTTYMVNDSTGCIKVSLFSKNTAMNISQSYREMNSPNNLILDLRANKGGLVNEAIHTSNLFLKSGVPIFRKIRRNKSSVTYNTQYDGGILTAKLFIIIDQESASASEIVTAALQHNKRATIIGERSKGKALIITPHPLTDQSMILIATSQYTTPNGGVIQRSYKGRKSSDQDGGIIPDINYDCKNTISNEDFIMFILSANKI